MLCGVPIQIVPHQQGMCVVPPPSLFLLSTPIVPSIKKVCAVSPTSSVCFFCAVSPHRISVPLPHSAMSWILSKVQNLSSSSLQDWLFLCVTWPQLIYHSSSTCIYECGTPSWACFQSWSWVWSQQKYVLVKIKCFFSYPNQILKSLKLKAGKVLQIISYPSYLTLNS